ncbi:MAG: TIGR02584 family CRISPR-associated protein [Balneolaceae bacterium]|nr:TIGR02584 family CRISPR-associated protein [Balneolaceae bacterium]
MSPKPKNKPITLIATIGSSPAVLTEAVYALYQRGIWPVVEIELITTSHGAEKIKGSLFRKNRYWQKLCDELGIDPFSVKIPFVHEIKGVDGPDGNELEDVRTSEEDARMAAEIQRKVQKHTEDSSKRVFGLLSGGRKTMSSHLMSAMQLFSRREDRLFHLLVSEPFENIPDFYFPTKESQPMKAKHSGKLYDAKDAVIDLINIPFIRFRPFLETRIDYSSSFDQLMAEADEQLLTNQQYQIYDLHIHLNGSDSALYVNGREHECRMEPRQLSILAFLVWMNIQQGEPFDIRWRDVVKDPDMREALHIFYRTAKEGNFEGINESNRQINLEEFQDEWLEYEYWHDENNKPLKRSFPKNKSVLFSQLESFLQQSGLSDIKREHIIRESSVSRRVVDRIIKIPVPVSQCHITGLHPKDAEMLGLIDESP